MFPFSVYCPSNLVLKLRKSIRVETTLMHKTNCFSVAVWRVQMLLDYEAKEVFTTGLLLAAGKDIHDTHISWDKYYHRQSIWRPSISIASAAHIAAISQRRNSSEQALWFSKGTRQNLCAHKYTSHLSETILKIKVLCRCLKAVHLTPYSTAQRSELASLCASACSGFLANTFQSFLCKHGLM